MMKLLISVVGAVVGALCGMLIGFVVSLFFGDVLVHGFGWNFFAVLAWALTIGAGIGSVVGALWLLGEYIEEEQKRNRVLDYFRDKALTSHGAAMRYKHGEITAQELADFIVALHTPKTSHG